MAEPDLHDQPSTRQVIRLLNHALSDLEHESFPTYASTWQDDLRCAAVHIADAHQEMTKYMRQLAELSDPARGRKDG